MVNLWVIIAGWWLNPTPLKNMKVNWDDYNQYIWKKINMFQTTNQICQTHANTRKYTRHMYIQYIQYIFMYIYKKHMIMHTHIQYAFIACFARVSRGFAFIMHVH